MPWLHVILCAVCWLTSSAVARSGLSPRRLQGRQLATSTTLTPDADPTICGDIIAQVDLPIDDPNQSIVFFARQAYECLTSVPFIPAVATRFIQYYNTTLQFQSTTAWLENPPQGYQQPPIDLFAGLEQIQQNVLAGVYKNQYDFEADIQRLINAAHDEHLVLDAGILSAFSFGSEWSITSVSLDGIQPPLVYIADDIQHIDDIRSQGYNISNIVSINGEDVVSFLTKFAANNSMGSLESHTEWNWMMETPAQDITYSLPTFSGSAILYPGDELVFEFANGSTPLNSSWVALYNYPPNSTGPLTTGGDFYNYFVLGLLPHSYTEQPDDLDSDTSGGDPNTDGPSSGSLNTTQISPNKTTTYFDASFRAYPDSPDIVQDDLSLEGGGVVTGYFLNDTVTGVLSLPTFVQYGSDVGHFSEAVSGFITNAKKRNVSRVVLDLQRNTGGNVELAFDTFRQFFPDIMPFAGSQRRIHPLANVLGSLTTNYWSQLPSSNEIYGNLVGSEMVITDRIDAATGLNFSSWEQYQGPILNVGDTYSLIERYNLSNILFDAAAFEDWLPYGYSENNPVKTSRPWNPEDVVILTDGLCASTCSLFLEMMTYQAGVRTVAVGGRPVSGPMQAVGGGRGAIAFAAEDLDDAIDFVNDFVLSGDGNDTVAAHLPNRTDTGIFINDAGVTLRHQVRNDSVPLQFKYQAADCRIYYTFANIYNMTRLWLDTAQAIFGNHSLCVTNSTGFPTGASNNTSNKPPPVPVAPSVQSFDFPEVSSELLDFDLDFNYTLFDGLSRAQSGSTPAPCQSNNGCAIESRVCVHNVEAMCSGSKQQVSQCVSKAIRGNCGKNENFVASGSVGENSLNSHRTPGQNETSPPTFHQRILEGYCYPNVGTTTAGCPS